MNTIGSDQLDLGVQTKLRELKVIGMAWALSVAGQMSSRRKATDPGPRLGSPRATSKQRSHIAQSDCHVSLELPSAKMWHKKKKDCMLDQQQQHQQSVEITCHCGRGGGGGESLHRRCRVAIYWECFPFIQFLFSKGWIARLEEDICRSWCHEEKAQEVWGMTIGWVNGVLHREIRRISDNANQTGSRRSRLLLV